ncbi:redoxin domain-containing protein [Rubrobacter taiwanensis]|jgi:peroxiredoxin|uniref:Redoxin domain-containing protein n=1 Tax=Rubrobacter taiwanensis TaxID=185139 RepID=A0A4R1BM54_9ACTN|nr:redoxin domain-containing protein [Rubrobacter taiwanensis]TCJ18426.1 redoxin domain-containing protein [Rubrobacter taiwanensis]
MAKAASVPRPGSEAPEIHLPSAQGGQFRLSVRTPRGPVVVVFFRGCWSGEDVEYFRALAEREAEINHAGATIAGVGVMEPQDAREFVRASGIKSYVLYGGEAVAEEYGLLARDREHGAFARPAVFIVGPDRRVAHAWVDGRPAPEEILSRVSEITGLPGGSGAEEEGGGG